MAEPKSVEAVAQQIDDHVQECARNYTAVERRLGRLELGMIAALVGIIGVLWEGYSATHPPVVAASVSQTLTTTSTKSSP